MATEAQNLSREMILPAYKAAISPGPAPQTTPLSSPPCQKCMTLIMQNKPNFLHTRMNISSALTKHYENKQVRPRPKNKPNQTQSKSRPLGRRTPHLSRTHPLHEIRDTLHETHLSPPPLAPLLNEAKSRRAGDLSGIYRERAGARLTRYAPTSDSTSISPLHCRGSHPTVAKKRTFYFLVVAIPCSWYITLIPRISSSLS